MIGLLTGAPASVQLPEICLTPSFPPPQRARYVCFAKVFVSDGAKCDIMRLQQMFGKDVTTAVQDPSYPVYVDTSVMLGQTGLINKETR